MRVWEENWGISWEFRNPGRLAAFKYKWIPLAQDGTQRGKSLLPMNVFWRNELTNYQFLTCFQKYYCIFLFVWNAFITEQGPPGSRQIAWTLRESDSFIKKSYTSSANFSAVATNPLDSIYHAISAMLSATVSLTVTSRPTFWSIFCYVPLHLQLISPFQV